MEFDINPFGKKKKKTKAEKREILRQNQIRGLASQKEAQMMAEINPFKDVKKIHKGGDRMERDSGFVTGRKGPWHTIEHKTGKAKQTKAQKEKQKKDGKKYHVERDWV